jgi:hypothetical protein
MQTRLIRIVGIIGIALIVLLALTGCFSSPESVIEDTIESLIEAENEAIESSNDNNSASEESSGAETEVEHSDTTQWPDELPDYIPPLDGDVVAHTKVFPEDGFTSHTIAFENMGSNDMDTYIDVLLSNGWSIDMQTELPDAWMVQAHRADSEFIIAGVELEENSGMINVTLAD